MKICFVIPMYKDEVNLKKLYKKIKKKFLFKKIKLYFVVINDGSEDKFNYLKSISNLRLINLKINVGSQKAIQIGINYALKSDIIFEYIIIMDSDGEDDPKYIVYQCPGGKVVRDFLTDPSLVMTPKPDEPPKSCDIENQAIVEGFQKSIDYSKEIENLDIILFVHKKCPYSKKQLSTTFTKMMKIVHINKRREKQMFTDHGGFATPYFFSKKTNRSYTGYLPTVDQIYSTLSLPEKFTYTPSNYEQKVKDLDIQVYNLHGCPHCDNFKTLLRKNKLIDQVTIIDDMEKMEAVHEIKGWPTIKSRKTGKSMTGAPFTIDVLISYLS